MAYIIIGLAPHNRLWPVVSSTRMSLCLQLPLTPLLGFVSVLSFSLVYSREYLICSALITRFSHSLSPVYTVELKKTIAPTSYFGVLSFSSKIDLQNRVLWNWTKMNWERKTSLFSLWIGVSHVLILIQCLLLSLL